MPRYAFEIEYNGAPFHGWQRQKTLPSVQGALESALLKIDPSNAGVQAAGRTDTGVHANGQVAHTDMAAHWDTFRLQEALNYHLKPLPVAIVDCTATADDFHARFSARERRYTYRLVSRRAPLVHDTGKVWQVKHPLDAAAMQAAANHLTGLHDFTTFRATHCQALSPVKTLDEITVETLPLPHATEYRFHLRARSFLHNQVRSIVGTLEHVGAGRWHPDAVRDALDARDRHRCGTVAPPHGLYLTGVHYPERPFATKETP
jgi:tRNA pseudouridine38-40 synthase